MKRIMITGGAGYVGSQLVPALLAKGYDVNVLDLYMYGDDVLSRVADHPNLRQIKGDIRDPRAVQDALTNCDTVIHLACISNDPSFELNPTLGRSINLDAFEPMIRMSKECGVRQFVYASSSSVYGVKDAPEVTEEMSLEPLTDYSKFKADCEELLWKHTNADFVGTCIRPATVCGYAPRQRLDVVVNILTNLGYHTGKIKILGGVQKRPNIHIGDMVNAYLHVLEQPFEKIQNKTYNVGFENFTVTQLGEMVRDVVSAYRPVEMVTEATNDNRSYHISSAKIQNELGFAPQFSIKRAIEDLCAAFAEGKLPDSLSNPRYFNIKQMQGIDLH